MWRRIYFNVRINPLAEKNDAWDEVIVLLNRIHSAAGLRIIPDHIKNLMQNNSLEAIQSFSGKYPKQLYLLFFTEMWERFTFLWQPGLTDTLHGELPEV
jgi:hypothetical protein